MHTRIVWSIVLCYVWVLRTAYEIGVGHILLHNIELGLRRDTETLVVRLPQAQQETDRRTYWHLMAQATQTCGMLLVFETGHAQFTDNKKVADIVFSVS